MAAIYRLYNGPAPTTAAQVKQGTGTAIRTMLQLSAKAGIDLKIKAWGWSGDGSAAATPGQVEFFETTVAATALTALASADVVRVTNPAGPVADTALITLGTGNSGFTASTTCTEGTVANARMFDAQLIAPTNQYIYQWPLGTEPLLTGGNFARIRCTFGAAINAICWMDFEG